MKVTFWSKHCFCFLSPYCRPQNFKSQGYFFWLVANTLTTYRHLVGMRCNQSAHTKHSRGIFLLDLSKVFAVSCSALAKHSHMRLESEGTPGCTMYKFRDTPWTHKPWIFILGRIIALVSLDDITTLLRGRLHLAWSIPSLDSMAPQ